MSNVYEISTDEMPQLLLVVSEDVKVPVDTFSGELDSATVIAYDNALSKKMTELYEKIISNDYFNSDPLVFSNLARLRKNFRNLYSSVFN